MLSGDGLGVCVFLLRSTSAVARLYSIAVHPEARGRGLARALLAAAIRRLPRRCTELSLEVRHENGSAHGLYRALGFDVHGHLPGYYPDGGHGLRMRAPRARIARNLAARGALAARPA